MAGDVLAERVEQSTFSLMCRQGLPLTEPGVSTTGAPASQPDIEAAPFHRLEPNKPWQNHHNAELFFPGVCAAEKTVLSLPKMTADSHGKLVCSYLRICADCTLLLQLFLNLTPPPPLCCPIIQASPMAEYILAEKSTFTLMSITFTLMSDAEKALSALPKVAVDSNGKWVCSYLCICAFVHIVYYCIIVISVSQLEFPQSIDQLSRFLPWLISQRRVYSP